MSKLLLSGILLLLVAAYPSDKSCSCTEALADDLPHGANELIEYPETTVKSIMGQVSYFHDDSPAEDVVVEVYEIPPADTKLKTYEFLREKQRKLACITSADGSFCFRNLPSGRYVVKAGTRSNRGMNEVVMRVKVDRRWWSRWFRPARRVKLELTVGT